MTDNLNFGNPEKPEIMGQFVAALRGMGEACRALDFPIVSGNVSLYNETEGRAILADPPPLAASACSTMRPPRSALPLPPGLDLVLIGLTHGHLGQSLWLREIARREEGPPPPVDLARERAAGEGGPGGDRSEIDPGLPRRLGWRNARGGR